MAKLSTIAASQGFSTTSLGAQPTSNVLITGGSVTANITSDSAVITSGRITANLVSSNVNFTSGAITANIVSANVNISSGRITANLVSSNATFTDPVIVGTILEDVYTISDGAAFEIDPGNGSVQLITLGASRTPKATNFANGESITMLVDDGSAYTLTWTDSTFGGSGVVWKTDSGSAPTLNTSGYTVMVLFKVAGQVYGARVGNA